MKEVTRASCTASLSEALWHGTIAGMDNEELSLCEEIDGRGLESSKALQRRQYVARRDARRHARPKEPIVPGLEVTYLEAEYIESAPAPLL